ncbi:MAG TPA: hypothetical protein VEC16_04450 [Alphaproteobacteria bacterium]|nr:hypothetical protein [Alphaproteobacteria bacterium]
MNCQLCQKEIKNYSEKFNKVPLDKPVDVCKECSEKFLKWQQSIFADLFPTKLMKKAYKK